ncbi:MAG: hypothetical protein WCJ92_02255 [Alphaproteobacteria bacterium]
MKNIFKAVAIFIVTYTTITAADTLVIGCRPWDENIQTVNGLSQAHFVDFQATGAPAEAPNFHHLDLNDAEDFSAGKFSEFAVQATKQYKMIIIDWITYQNIRRSETWKDFLNLLGEGGRLIVPVTAFDPNRGVITSAETAQAIRDNLLRIGFQASETSSHDAITSDTALALLTQDRGGMLACMLSMEPAIIIATK